MSGLGRFYADNREFVNHIHVSPKYRQKPVPVHFYCIYYLNHLTNTASKDKTKRIPLDLSTGILICLVLLSFYLLLRVHYAYMDIYQSSSSSSSSSSPPPPPYSSSSSFIPYSFFWIDLLLS